MRRKAKSSISVPNKRRSGQILSEKISHHIARGTVNKTNHPISHSLAQSKNSIVNVLAAFTVCGIFTHHPSSPVIFIQRSRSMLHNMKVTKSATKPQ